MRRRVKDDVKAAQTEHQAYLSDVGKLRKTYERRVEEVQAHEEAESAREHEGWPPGHWSDSEGSGRARSHSTASSKGDRDRDSSPPPIHSPPLVSPPAQAPVFVSGATSTGASSNAYRDAPQSGKPANVFDAIAKRDWSGEKRGIHKFMGAVRDRVGEGQGQLKPSAVRGVKARQVSSKLKREAEQAGERPTPRARRRELMWCGRSPTRPRLQERNLPTRDPPTPAESPEPVRRAVPVRVCRRAFFQAQGRAHLEHRQPGSSGSRTGSCASLPLCALERILSIPSNLQIAQDFVPKVRLINPVADEEIFKAQLRNAAPPEAKVYCTYFICVIRAPADLHPHRQQLLRRRVSDAAIWSQPHGLPRHAPGPASSSDRADLVRS